MRKQNIVIDETTLGVKIQKEMGISIFERKNTL